MSNSKACTALRINTRCTFFFLFGQHGARQLRVHSGELRIPKCMIVPFRAATRRSASSLTARVGSWQAHLKTAGGAELFLITVSSVTQCDFLCATHGHRERGEKKEEIKRHPRREFRLCGWACQSGAHGFGSRLVRNLALAGNCGDGLFIFVIVIIVLSRCCRHAFVPDQMKTYPSFFVWHCPGIWCTGLQLMGGLESG